jgi:hypothetical protein
MTKLQVLATVDNADGAKSLTDREVGSALAHLAEEELKQQFSRTLASITSIFSEESLKKGPLRIKEITLKFEITTKGEVRLIASAGVEAKGAIEVKLTNS